MRLHVPLLLLKEQRRECVKIEDDEGKVTVESFLDSVDYSVDSDYVPSEFALEFVTFIKMVNGAEGEENKTRRTRLARFMWPSCLSV